MRSPSNCDPLDRDALFAELSARIDRLAEQAGDTPADDWLYAAFDQWQESVVVRALATDSGGGAGLRVLGLACDQGCSHCCHQVVQLSVLEARLLASELLQQLSPHELAELRLRLHTGWDRLRALGIEGLAMREQVQTLNGVRRACPLLDAATGRCRAYAARPIACRREHSLDAEVCQRFLVDPNTDIEPTRFPAIDLAWSTVRRLLQSWIDAPDEGPVSHILPLELGLLLALEETDEPTGA